MITIKRTTPASRSYGRGPDSCYIPAHYGVFDNDKLVGSITGTDTRYMGSIQWNVDKIDEQGIWRPVAAGLSFKKAKQRALNHFNS